MRYSLEEQKINIEDKLIQFKILEELNKKQFDEISNCLEEIDLLLKVEDYFLIVEKNYNDLIKFISQNDDKLNKEQLAAFLNENYLRKLKIEVNRHILNYLSSARTYIDHVARLLKKINLSEEFELKISNIYDGNFSYRFYSRLRNYSQHKGIPLTYVSCEVINNDVSKMIYAYDINFLMNDYNSWSSVKEDLKKFEGRKLDCLVVSEKYHSNIKEINNFAYSINKKNVKKSIDFLKTILDKYKNVDRVTLVNELNDKTLKVKLISKEKINTINQLI